MKELVAELARVQFSRRILKSGDFSYPKVHSLGETRLLCDRNLPVEDSLPYRWQRIQAVTDFLGQVVDLGSDLGHVSGARGGFNLRRGLLDCGGAENSGRSSESVGRFGGGVGVLLVGGIANRHQIFIAAGFQFIQHRQGEIEIAEEACHQCVQVDGCGCPRPPEHGPGTKSVE